MRIVQPELKSIALWLFDLMLISLWNWDLLYFIKKNFIIEKYIQN